MAERKKPTITSNFSPLGSTGLRQSGGFISEEFLAELAGVRGSRTYRRMADNDATCAAILFAITTLIRQTEWTVQAADDSDEADEAKTFVEEVMQDMSVPWSTVIAEICSMFTYGFAPMEIVWKRRIGPDEPTGETRSKHTDGAIGIRTIALRAQPTITRWEIDPEDGGILGFWQQPYDKPMVFIPIEKALLFRTTEERNNPEGRSILRSAYRSWYFSEKIEEIEGVGIERDLAGLPVAYIPARFFDTSATPEEKAVMGMWQALVTNIRRDKKEGLVLPSERDQSGNLIFDLKLLSTAGSRTFDTTKIVDRYQRKIATSVLADFIFLGQQAVGSFALSSDKTALFATAIGAFTKAVADVFNRHMLPRLWALNALDPDVMPTMVCGELENPNLAELGEYITSMTGAGAQMFPDRELENHLRKLAGLPAAPEDQEGSADPMAEMPGMEQEPLRPVPPDKPEPEVMEKRATRVHKRLIYDDAGVLQGIVETTMTEEDQ